jgi:hypothetical protein
MLFDTTLKKILANLLGIIIVNYMFERWDKVMGLYVHSVIHSFIH